MTSWLICRGFDERSTVTPTKQDSGDTCHADSLGVCHWYGYHRMDSDVLMKIPGLDEALKKLDKFDEMQPVLEEIRDNLDRLVRIQIAFYDMEAQAHGLPEIGEAL